MTLTRFALATNVAKSSTPNKYSNLQLKLSPWHHNSLPL